MESTNIIFSKFFNVSCAIPCPDVKREWTNTNIIDLGTNYSADVKTLLIKLR